jgi:hypothetical protein
MGGMFGGALVAMQVVGEMQSRLEYNLLSAEQHEHQHDASVPAQSAPGWRQSLARALVRLSDRIAPELRPVSPVTRLDPCPC